MIINFTQYLLLDGKSQPVSIHRPIEIAMLAKEGKRYS